MKQITWPTAVVLIVGLVVLGTAYLVGPAVGVPAESHTEVVVAIGGFGMLALSAMRAILSKDSDHDGVPDVLDRPTPDPRVPDLDDTGAGS